MLYGIHVFWSAEGWVFCVVSLHEADSCTVVLILCSAVVFCVYFVNLRCADGYVIVLGNVRRLCACLWDYVSIQQFITLLIVFCYFMLGLLLQLLWLFYFALYFGCLTVPHKTPSSGARWLKGPRADIVSVLGTTPSIATLLGKRPEGSDSDELCAFVGLR